MEVGTAGHRIRSLSVCLCEENIHSHISRAQKRPHGRVDFLEHLRTPAEIARRLPPFSDEVIEFLGFLRNFRLLKPVQINFAQSLDRHRHPAVGPIFRMFVHG